ADVKCLSLLYLYVGRYPRNNASRNIKANPLPHKGYPNLGAAVLGSVDISPRNRPNWLILRSFLRIVTF
ncbi:MAG: hypothetical protein BECKG1743F_GA0114225_104031, partial [Candidatus Kentron sp. G]